MGLSDEQRSFLLDVAKLIVWCNDHGYKVTAGELYRTPEMQEIYFNTGRSKIKTGGYHGKRLAIDLNIFIKVEGRWKLTYSFNDTEPIGEYWESLNKKNDWGGRWKSIVDTPHFQRTI